ncbi:hypothetical protein [Microcoleus sp. B3-D7]|uniref:hypothetical protein n=1 Tax=Microcoleus sp. B3-D7 TaxID=2818659 RepID=UPI002FD73E50
MYIDIEVGSIEYLFSLSSEGSLFWMLRQSIPLKKRKYYMSFWSGIIDALGQNLKNQIKAMHLAKLETHFFKLLVNIFFWVIDVLTPRGADFCKIETSRDPPKIFIPIPKIELNGCARSDSLIYSLIF